MKETVFPKTIAIKIERSYIDAIGKEQTVEQREETEKKSVQTIEVRSFEEMQTLCDSPFELINAEDKQLLEDYKNKKTTEAFCRIPACMHITKSEIPQESQQLNGGGIEFITALVKLHFKAINYMPDKDSLLFKRTYDTLICNLGNALWCTSRVPFEAGRSSIMQCPFVVTSETKEMAVCSPDICPMLVDFRKLILNS